MKLEFMILNYQFEPIGIVDSYKSAIWNERFYTVGDIELYVPNTTYYNEILRLPDDGHSLYVMRKDDPTKLGIITQIKYTEDPDSGDMITAVGHTDDYLLHYRVLVEQATYNGNIEVSIRHMVSNAFINSDGQLPHRVSTHFKLGSRVGISSNIKLQVQGNYLDEMIAQLCQEHGFGYSVTFDYANKDFYFNLIKPTDRSLDQSATDPIIFSARLDNITSSEYDQLIGVDAAYAFGEGNGAYKYVNYYDTTFGATYPLERREHHVDAEKISNNQESIDNFMLSELLEQTAKSYVVRNGNRIEAVTAEILANTTFKLNQDYFLGDVVQVMVECGTDRSQTRSFKQRVIEVIEAFDDTGYSCIPTFETI